MSSADVLLSRLIVKRTGRGRWICKCPSHNDRTASLAVRELDDGRVLVHCFAGCGPHDVLGAVGLGIQDLFPERLQGTVGKPESRPFPAADVLRAIGFEAKVVAIAAVDLSKIELINKELKDRLLLSATRIQAGLVSGGVDHV